MRFAFLLFLAMTLPANAQQQVSTITLSCNGTGKFTATSAADLKPDPIKDLGIIVNVTDRTVTLMDYVVPLTGITATIISFNGQTPPVVSGVKLKPFHHQRFNRPGDWPHHHRMVGPEL